MPYLMIPFTPDDGGRHCGEDCEHLLEGTAAADCMAFAARELLGGHSTSRVGLVWDGDGWLRCDACVRAEIKDRGHWRATAKGEAAVAEAEGEGDGLKARPTQIGTEAAAPAVGGGTE
jgi:hypothetical protein